MKTFFRKFTFIPAALSVLCLIALSWLYLRQNPVAQAAAGEIFCRGWTANSTSHKIYTPSDAAWNVGIGTTNPPNRLTISDGGSPYGGGTNRLLQLYHAGANQPVEMMFANTSNGFTLRYGNGADRFDFVDGGNVTVMSLKNGGNVGIGKTDPTEKLDVAGKVKANELCIGNDCKSSWPTTAIKSVHSSPCCECPSGSYLVGLDQNYGDDDVQVTGIRCRDF